MENNLTILALIQIGICLILGVGLLFLTFSILHKRIIKKYKIEKDNVAFSIFTAGVLLSVTLLLKSVIHPTLAAFHAISGTGVSGVELYLEVTKYGGLFVFIGVVLVFIINTLSIVLFTSITRGLDEFKEISENNMAVGILTATIIVSVSILCQDGLEFLLETFIPYPEFPSGR